MLDYVSVGDLAVFLDVEAATLDAATANLATASAMQSVRKYLAQELTYHANDVVRLDGTGTRLLRLPERPVRAVTLVEEESAGGTDWTTVPASDYFLRGSTLFREAENKSWRRGKVNVRVTYDHGWNTAALDSDSDFTHADNLPADISLVTLNAARRIYESSGANPSPPLGVRQETIGSYAVTYAAEAIQVVELTKYEKAVLDRYRIA